ncbi:MAG: sugar phosphate isomerase/epimerase [Armatimonadetes bacterium]|nr:sugar phosphate isomerase/epimerase [Armatimonadota bacterium]MDI9602026.1 sugar phosphate isomerase/epimerase family protein [Acidobacteriota bacterium]
MAKLKISVMLESFRKPLREALDLAVAVGASGCQIYVTSGEMHPDAMGPRQREEFRELVVSKGLEISALCGEMGGYTDPRRTEEFVTATKAFMDLAVDLGPRILTAHIGAVGDSPANPAWRAVASVLEQVGQHGDEIGCVFACETGMEEPELLRGFIESLDTHSIRINYDPANLVMAGYDPIGGLKHLGDLVVHTHAKDGVRGRDGRVEEVALGKGQVPFAEYVAGLRAVGYDGYYTIEREVGDDPMADIEMAASYLASL